MKDIVFPNGNEKEFLEIARKLGLELIFVYPLAKYKKIEGMKTGIRAANKKEIEKARRLSELVVIKSKEEEDRYYLEKSKVDLVFDFELSPKEDFLHGRRSGLNHILTRIAKEKNKIIGFSFSSILNSKNKARLMGRIMQNIRICRKAKVKMAVCSFASSPYELRSRHDLKAFFICLGMHPKEAQESVERFK